MEGRLQSSAFGSFQQQGAARSTQQRQPIVQQYALIIDQSQRHLLADSSPLISSVSLNSSTNDNTSAASPAPGVLVHGSAFLKQEARDSAFDPQYGGSYSVERLLQQQASNVVDAKPTISPALLSAVDLVSSSQDPFQSLHQRQQEQLALAQQHLTLSASSLLTPARTALLHQQPDSPLAGLHSSLQPLLNTPPPPVITSPHLHRRNEIGPPLPQLNSLVRNIDRRLQGVVISPAVLGVDASTSQQQAFLDRQLIRVQELQEGQSQANRFGLGAGAIISPSLSESPSSCGGSEQQNAALELSSVKDEASQYQARAVSPLRGRGRPTTNPILDGSPRQHPCPECGKAFPNNSALVKHRLIHSDERNFVCPVCQKAFKRQDHLNGHLNVHKTVKPFPCIFGNCDKSYCDARSLRRHLEHSHSVQNPVVHSSKGTVYIKCDDLEATVLPNRAAVSDEANHPAFNLVETSSGSTVPSQDFPPDHDSYGASAISPGDEQVQHNLVSPTLGLEHGRRVSKSVECAQCGRTFKNMPALNGHMRLHSNVTGRGETTPRSFDEMSSKGDHSALPVFVTPPVGSMAHSAHSGHSSSAPGSTPITGTSPVDALMQQRHHQALAQALAASTSATTSATYQQHMQQQQRDQGMDCGYNQNYHSDRPGPGLLMYAPSQHRPSLLHQHSQQHGVYHVSDAQVQTVHDYASPMSSRPPSHCSTTHTIPGYMVEAKQEHEHQHHVQTSHQHNHGYANILSVNTSSLNEGTGGNESMLSGSDDPTMMSPHLASLTGLDVSASPDLALKPPAGAGGTGGGSGMTSGAMVPMLAGPSVTNSPYCSSLRTDDVDASGQRPVSVDFGFPPNYTGVDMPSSSTGGHLGMHHGSHHHMASHMGSSGGAACHMEGPLDLGPELSKDVDDELIQKELLSFMPFPGSGEGIFNPFMADDDEMLFSSGPAKLTERKRHMTAPSALTLGAGAYPSAGALYPVSSAHMDHHYQYQQQQSSSSSFSGYGSKPGSILNNYEQNEAVSSMNMLGDDGGSASSNQFIPSSSLTTGGNGQQSSAHGHHVGISHHSGASASGNGKKSRPASRQRRKSRGKPDNVFMLLKSVGLRRSFNLPVSPPRFRKHSAAVVETGRKFSIGGGSEHRGGGTSGKCHHRSGGSLQQRHANRPKPAPLLIPGATLNRFHSQLRSPRLWVGTALSGCAAYAKSGYSTPTPYTPPPILSPVRHGSGLFWTISKALAAFAGPKSAPISPRFGRGFWPKALPPAPPSTDSQGGPPGAVVASGTVSGGISDSSSEGIYSGIVANSARVVSPLELTEGTDLQPPATDTTPHINVGFQYQAEIPDFIPAGPPKGYGEYEKAEMVFSPKVCQKFDDTEIDAYCKVASSIVASGGGRNAEYAMHLLYALNGDLERAYFTLLSPEAGRSVLASVSSGCLSDYEYVDTCLWTCEEIMKFQEAIVKYDKDFCLISSFVATKNTKQCVQFYYTWKKMCTDEYKRLRAARRRRILPAMALEPNVYDLRSLGPIETLVPSAAVGSPFAVHDQPKQEAPEPTVQGKMAIADLRRDEDIGHVVSDFVIPTERNGRDSTFNKSQYENEVDSVIKAYNESPFRESPATETGSTSDTVFPCRLCGKVFYKVKSRNAHMKSHSVATSKKNSPAPAATSVGLH